VLDVAPDTNGDDDELPGSLHGPVVVTGRGRLLLRRVQPESRSPMSAEEWLRGVRPGAGERLGTD
jgi:methionyl-tRNA formyltransferase